MASLVMDPPQPPASHRVPLTCDRHPDESFTGFCASCLRERLSGLDSTSATTRRNSTSTISSSLKSIFFKPPAAAASLQPELRRCKSFSCGRGDGASVGPCLSAASFEPQRKSCDVRGRNTLWSLFNQENVAHSAAGGGGEIEDEGDEIVVVETSGEIQEIDEADDLIKPMKDHIELESPAKRPPAKDLKEIAGSFWLAASVFSKKLQKWRRKQKLKKMKKQEELDSKTDSKCSRRFRETQSEIAVDAFGRRSLDIDPRFSLDAGRISFDDPRCSFDEPRASWDGYLIGARSFLSRPPPMLSVVEDSPIPAVQRTDGEIPVEEDIIIPGAGGSVQRNDCCSDSSSRSRRLSLDRSNSVRKSSSEANEAKPVSNAKASLAGSAEFCMDWSSTSNSNSLRADRSESFESAFRKDHASKLPSRKKQKRWSKAWSIWGLIHRRKGSRGGGNAADISFSEPWPELRTNGYHANGRISRCNSNSSLRSSSYGNGGLGIGKKRRDEFVLERNRSARHSPRHVDNGLLRFYLTPMRGSRRGSGKGKHGNGYHSFARSVLQLY